MLSEEQINRVNEILNCDNCPTSYACEGCDITQNDKLLIKKYISELEISNKELAKENNRLEKIEFERDMANKIIDEMAKWIFDKDYTENSLFIHRDDYYSNCIKQVKQYFEKKVEEKE